MLSLACTHVLFPLCLNRLHPSKHLRDKSRVGRCALHTCTLYFPWIVVMNFQSEKPGGVWAPKGDTSFFWVVKCLCGTGVLDRGPLGLWDKPG